MLWSLFSAFRPFGASAKFLLRNAATQRARKISQTLRGTPEFRYFLSVAIFLAMPAWSKLQIQFRSYAGFAAGAEGAGSGIVWNVSLASSASYLDDSKAV